MSDLPNAVIKRLLTKHSGGLRVSGTALGEAGLELAILYLPVPHDASTLEPLANELAPLA